MKWHEGIKDFRGMHLCRNCWDGDHFGLELIRVYCAFHKTHPKEDEESESCKKCRWRKGTSRVCHCQLGECECPCSRMDQNRRDDNQTRRTLAAENKKHQLAIQAPMMAIGKI